MEPRLATIDGPLKGTSFSLTGKEFSIGQNELNDLCLQDSLVSRRHCAIRRTSEGFEVRDLGSTNGTFVNNIPIQTHQLAQGDILSLGKSVFIYLEEEGVSPDENVDIDEEEPISRSAIHLNHRKVVELQQTPWLAAPDLTERKGRALEALLRISQLVTSVASLADLKVQLLDLILEIIPAERAVILLMDGAAETFTTVYARKRAVLEEPIPVSRTILTKVRKERTAVLSKHILQSEFRRSKSLYGAGVESVLCVPLQIGDRFLGAIYLETRERDGFDEEHLRLVTTISGVSAVAFDNCRRVEWLEAETERLRTDLGLQHNMVGDSPSMRELYEVISRVAPTDSTVLISGESGTGKELAARAVHRNSARASFPFVAINCAAISEFLLESELFGHEKGAFTGAVSQKKGKLEVADQGTLFLDEISELALPLQAKLLRVLEEQQFERVGGTRPIRVDIRLIAATNEILSEAIQRGDFREDLFYRLNVVSIEMPPLRERMEDLPLLVQYLIGKFSGKSGRAVRGISEEALSLLKAYHWPGNVRELQNVVERAVVLGSGDLILAQDLPRELQRPCPAPAAATTYHEAVQLMKRDLILVAVSKANGNITEAARMLDLQPTYLHRLVRKLELREEIRRRFQSSAQ